MPQHASAAPTFNEALAVWARIGVLSFGGPAGQIALMHRVLVDERKWIGEEPFLHALNFCMLLPGPEAMQLATYVGWRLHGTLGGLAAGLLFVLPGALVVLALSIAYALYGQLPFVEAAFVGIKAAVLVIVIEALLRVAKRALREPAHWLIAGAAFVAIFFFDVPFPSGDRRRRSVGLCACRHESRRTARASKQNPSRAPRPNVAHGKPVARHLDRAACHHGPRCLAATMSSPTSPSSSRSSPS